MNRRVEQFYLPTGSVIIEYPETLSTDDVSDLALYFDMLIARLKRFSNHRPIEPSHKEEIVSINGIDHEPF